MRKNLFLRFISLIFPLSLFIFTVFLLVPANLSQGAIKEIFLYFFNLLDHGDFFIKSLLFNLPPHVGVSEQIIKNVFNIKDLNSPPPIFISKAGLEVNTIHDLIQDNLYYSYLKNKMGFYSDEILAVFLLESGEDRNLRRKMSFNDYIRKREAAFGLYEGCFEWLHLDLRAPDGNFINPWGVGVSTFDELIQDVVFGKRLFFEYALSKVMIQMYFLQESSLDRWARQSTPHHLLEEGYFDRLVVEAVFKYYAFTARQYPDGYYRTMVNSVVPTLSSVMLDNHFIVFLRERFRLPDEEIKTFLNWIKINPELRKGMDHAFRYRRQNLANEFGVEEYEFKEIFSRCYAPQPLKRISSFFHFNERREKYITPTKAIYLKPAFIGKLRWINFYCAFLVDYGFNYATVDDKLKKARLVEVFPEKWPKLLF